MMHLALAVLLTLAAPAVAAASAGGIGGGGKAAATLDGLREWEAHRATSTKLLGELEADPARGKAVGALEREWKTLDRKMQKVRELQTQGKLDAKTARVQADDLAASMKKLESAQEEIRNMLSSVLKTINEMRGIGAGSRSGL